jgi:hypothetical protein
MAFTVTLIRDDETESARDRIEHADNWLSMHADEES